MFTFAECVPWGCRTPRCEVQGNTTAWSGSLGEFSSACFPESPIPERCIEAYYLQCTRFETIPGRSCASAS